MTKANLVLALVMSWPAYMAVKIVWHWIEETRAELKDMWKERMATKTFSRDANTITVAAHFSLSSHGTRIVDLLTLVHIVGDPKLCSALFEDIKDRCLNCTWEEWETAPDRFWDDEQDGRFGLGTQ